MNIPDWLKEECKKDETIEKIVSIGQDKNMTTEVILDVLCRFLLDREARILKELFKYTQTANFPAAEGSTLPFIKE